jgi:hypothetical protein
MKDTITIDVPAVQGGHVGFWTVILTRRQVEAALAELNAPEPLKGGDRVEHINKEFGTYMVLAEQPTPTYTRTVGLLNGRVYLFPTDSLKRIE